MYNALERDKEKYENEVVKNGCLVFYEKALGLKEGEITRNF